METVLALPIQWDGVRVFWSHFLLTVLTFLFSFSFFFFFPFVFPSPFTVSGVESALLVVASGRET